MTMDTLTDPGLEKKKKKKNNIKEKTGFKIIRINPEKKILISLMRLVKYKNSFLTQKKN